MTFFAITATGPRRLCTSVLLVLLTLGMSACAPATDPAVGTGAPMLPSGTQLSGTLQVFAAASLKDTFTVLAAQFQEQNPQARVSLSFDGSSSLATQISHGAPADVFASADTATMSKLADAALLTGSPVNFASNALTLVVPPDNPANITTFADVAAPGVKLVVCAPQVPCGAASRRDAASAAVALHPVSEELSVTGVLGKVISGEADAGLVYVTDARSAGARVLSIPLNLSVPTINRYPIAAVGSTEKSALAQGFIRLVTGSQGQKVLQEAGFGAP